MGRIITPTTYELGYSSMFLCRARMEVCCRTHLACISNVSMHAFAHGVCPNLELTLLLAHCTLDLMLASAAATPELFLFLGEPWRLPDSAY